MILLPLALATASERPLPSDFQKLVEAIDMTSFDNSIGPRRRPDATTLTDYGFDTIEPTSASTVRADEGDRWEMTFGLLSRTKTRARICFTDRATNGGSYYARYTLMVWRRNGKVVARQVADPRCPQTHHRSIGLGR